MRRMYSEQELTTIIKAVFDEEVESGVFDDKIKEYAEDWLEENPLSPGDLDFSAINFVAKTLSQSNVNWSNTFGFSNYYGLTITEIYCKLQVINNRLDIIVNFSAKNETANDITTKYIASGVAVLNSAIASKVIDFNGDDATETPASPVVVCGSHALEFYALTDNASSGNQSDLIVYNNTNANYLLIRVNNKEDATFQPSEERFYTARIQLDLI